MMQHLSFTKWRDSAFSTEQLRTVRWLLGAKPKGLPDSLADILTVSAQAQSMLVELHIRSFTEATRRLKVSAWSRKRASAEDFDKMVDFACMFSHLRIEAKRVNSDASVDSKLVSAFLAKRSALNKRNFVFSVSWLVVMFVLLLRACSLLISTITISGTTSRRLKQLLHSRALSSGLNLCPFGWTLCPRRQFHLLCSRSLALTFLRRRNRHLRRDSTRWRSDWQVTARPWISSTWKRTRLRENSMWPRSCTKRPNWLLGRRLLKLDLVCFFFCRGCGK